MNIFFYARRLAIEASNFDNFSSIDTAVQPRVVFLDVATSSSQELLNRCCFVELEQLGSKSELCKSSLSKI